MYKNGRPDHMEGYHDDIIMAYAMCIFIVQTSFKKLEMVEKQTKAMLESWVNVNSKTVMQIISLLRIYSSFKFERFNSTPMHQ